MAINFTAETHVLRNTIAQLVDITGRVHESTCNMYNGNDEFLHNAVEAEACDEVEIIAKRLRLIADGIEGAFK